MIAEMNEILADDIGDEGDLWKNKSCNLIWSDFVFEICLKIQLIENLECIEHVTEKCRHHKGCIHRK